MNTMWEPQFDGWSEKKVSLSSANLLTNSTSRGEYGVMMEAGEEPYKGKAAIFWIDATHIYLRYDWGHWYTVSTDDKENCDCICKRHSAVLMRCSRTSVKYHTIPVYHIEKLPENLFEKESYETHDTHLNNKIFDFIDDFSTQDETQDEDNGDEDDDWGADYDD